MTRATNARIAGIVFLLYIATGIVIMILSAQATGAEGTAAKLAGIARHASLVRLTIVLGLLTTMYALALGVTLYGLTRDQDPELALLALSCRIGEGVLGVVPTLATLGLLWLSAGGAGASLPDAAAANTVGEFLFRVQDWNTLMAATFFAVGSTLFSCLFLRGRLIPVPLAWIGVVASIVLVVGLPIQLAGFLSGPITSLMWLPMVVFEVPLGLWLLIKGVASPAPR
ncbi:MAG: DUF4386 domain-containing protein [Acidobacteriia bacterium]|nr:DUF4386 domain-containing protein [Terriglobia bacterium]